MGEQCRGKDYESWVEAIIAFYGDVKPSMLQDLERGRKTEVDFINGYVVTLGHASGVPVHMNATITDLVHQIEHEVLQPTRERMNDLAAQIADRPAQTAQTFVLDTSQQYSTANSDRLSHFGRRISLFMQTLVLGSILSSEQEHRQENMNPGSQRSTGKAVLKTASRFAGARELKNSALRPAFGVTSSTSRSK
jgi:Ketopantoate reductase PanE/ApbA C terminal